ncbi:Uncharacterized protein HZ326_6394 [Fusarium oxysporum f. sp. albedinis]|nr:Uncharacterized protein HZ326_6394 [Fusarium oxysporum f. sp. albedinis]
MSSIAKRFDINRYETSAEPNHVSPRRNAIIRYRESRRDTPKLEGRSTVFSWPPSNRRRKQWLWCDVPLQMNAS